MLRKFLFGSAALALTVASATAQVNTVPQIGVNIANLRQNTYIASIRGLVPAASTTDFFCISSSTTKTIRIHRIELSGSGTLGSSPIYLNRNTTVDTGTAAVAATYGPIAYPLATTNSASTATVVAYNTTGGNPTVAPSGATTILRVGNISVSPTSSTTAGSDRLVWTFGTAVSAYDQSLVIPANGTEQVCLNLAASSLTAVLGGSMEWTEE